MRFTRFSTSSGSTIPTTVTFWLYWSVCTSSTPALFLPSCFKIQLICKGINLFWKSCRGLGCRVSHAPISIWIKPEHGSMHSYENNRSCKIKRASSRVGVKDQIWDNIAEHDMQDHQATFTIAHNVALTWHLNKSLTNFVFTFRAAHRYPQFNSL